MRRVVVLLALSACGYPQYEFVPTDASDDLGRVDSPSDSANEFGPDEVSIGDSRADAVGSDAGNDTVARDTSTPDTSARDASDASASDTPDVVETSTGCDGSSAIVCEDWDKATAPKAAFDWQNLDPTSSLALEASGRSLPNTLVASTAPGDAAVVTADLGKHFVAPRADSTIRIDAWLKLESAALPTTTGGAFLFKLERGGPGSVGDGVTFSINDKGFFVDRIGLTYKFYPVPFKPLVGAWMHVRMDVKLGTAAGAITVWIDDMSTPQFADTAVSTVQADTTERNFIVGLYAQNATGAFRARYDDVSVGLAP